jgi:hypothetical protein
LSRVRLHLYPGVWPHELGGDQGARIRAWWRVAGVATVYYDPEGLDLAPLFAEIKAAGVPWSLAVGISGVYRGNEGAVCLDVRARVQTAIAKALAAGLGYPILVIVDFEPLYRSDILDHAEQMPLFRVISQATRRMVVGKPVYTPQNWYYVGRQLGLLTSDSSWTGPPCWPGVWPGCELYWPERTPSALRAISAPPVTVPYITTGAHYSLAPPTWPLGSGGLPLVWSFDGSAVNYRWTFEAGRALRPFANACLYPNPWDSRGVLLWEHTCWLLAGLGCSPVDGREPPR